MHQYSNRKKSIKTEKTELEAGKVRTNTLYSKCPQSCLVTSAGTEKGRGGTAAVSPQKGPSEDRQQGGRYFIGDIT